MALTEIDKVYALANFFLAGVVKGHMVDFAIGLDNGTIEVAEIGTNDEKNGFCHYDTSLQTFAPGPQGTTILIAPHQNGSCHIFVCYPLPEFDWYDPIYFVGKVVF